MLNAFIPENDIDKLPCPGYENVKQRTRVWMEFRRGTLVCWCPDPKTAALEFGVVDCESVTKPGSFFIRSEHNKLWCVNWQLLSKTKKKT